MVNWVQEVPRSLASYIVHSLTLTQDWVYKLTINQHLLLANGFGLSWSISCEFFFYLAYAMFVFAILTLARPGRGLAVLGLYSVAVVGALTLVFLNLDGVLAFFRAHWSNFIPVEENQDSSFYRWFFYYSPYARIWEFVLGCLTAQLFLVVQDRPISEAKPRAQTSCCISPSPQLARLASHTPSASGRRSSSMRSSSCPQLWLRNPDRDRHLLYVALPANHCSAPVATVDRPARRNQLFDLRGAHLDAASVHTAADRLHVGDCG